MRSACATGCTKRMAVTRIGVFDRNTFPPAQDPYWFAIIVSTGGLEAVQPVCAEGGRALTAKQECVLAQGRVRTLRASERRSSPAGGASVSYTSRKPIILPGQV